MNINTIDIVRYSTSHLICTEDRLFHKKSLPILSVVQALEGSYGIGIDTPIEQLTGTMGTFIAPKKKMQYITHYVNQNTKIMRAHWIFLDVIINGMYALDDIFDFPVLMPLQYNQQVHDIIASVESNNDLCDNLSDIYKLIKIFLAIGTPKLDFDHQMNEILRYINQHYAEAIAPGQLAGFFGLSTATLFRKFKKLQGLTPSNYVNSVRLAQASMMLETTDYPIGQICMEVGIEDVYYFSRLFKFKYGLSPLNYRKQVRKNGNSL